MISPYTFTAPSRIRFGWGVFSELPKEAAALGRRVLIVTGGRSFRESGQLDELVTRLAAENIVAEVFSAEPEPTVESCDRAVEVARVHDAEAVIAIGGGSAMDTGKAAAALVKADFTAAQALEGRELPRERIGLICVPTTSGTGSECAMAVVFTNAEKEVKASFRGLALLPDLALVDPELTVSCPPELTARVGFDAFTQAIESYLSLGAGPLTDPLALDATRRLEAHLERAVREGADREAREQVAQGSMTAGITLNNARLGLVHGLAHPVGYRTHAHHGLVCGLLLPAVLRYNQEAARDRLARLAAACGLEEATAEAFIRRVEEIQRNVGLTGGLKEIGLEREMFEGVARDAMPSGSTKSNPRPVTESDAKAVLEAAYG
ncbi:MAG: iron-containing alcohol dehydrogenase [Armatimonadetes bacterium]|nr:iron-containing alcohol dehydrogenase [Armatimonadota bacterium]